MRAIALSRESLRRESILRRPLTTYYIQRRRRRCEVIVVGYVYYLRLSLEGRTGIISFSKNTSSGVGRRTYATSTVS